VAARFLWAENSRALPLSLLAVCLLRVAATTAAVAAGGCGGVFVPFLAIGDIGGRVFAPSVGIGNDLAGAAGAAAGISGGYRLPLTAVAMVIGIGGAYQAKLTCLATVANRLRRRRRRASGARADEEARARPLGRRAGPQAGSCRNTKSPFLPPMTKSSVPFLSRWPTWNWRPVPVLSSTR